MSPGELFGSIYAYAVGTITGTVDTAATLATLPGPSAYRSQTVYVQEYGQSFRFVPGSTATADGFAVIGVAGGVSGRWLVDGPRLYLIPTGSDDAARVTAAFNSMGAIGGGVVLMGGHGSFLWQSLHQWASGTLEGSDSTVAIVSSLSGAVGNFTVSALAVTTGAASALSVNVVPGVTTFTTATPVAGAIVGSIVAVGDIAGLAIQQYTITRIVGTTYTVERPIWPPYTTATGTASLVVGPPTVTIRDILIVGISGDRAIELSFGRYCLLQRVRVVSLAAGVVYTLPDGTTVTGVSGFTGIVLSSDTAGYCPTFDDVSVDAGGTGNAAIACESNEGAVYRNCTGLNAAGGTGAAFFLNASVSCLFTGLTGDGSAIGALLDGGVSQPSVFCQIRASTFEKNGAGVQVVGSGWLIDGCEANYSTASGFVVAQASAGAVSDIQILNFRAEHNGGHGVSLTDCSRVTICGYVSSNGDDAVLVTSTATGTSIPWLTGGANSGFSVRTSASLAVGALYSYENVTNAGSGTGGALFADNAASVVIGTVHATASWNGGGWLGVECNGANTRVRIIGGVMVTAGTGAKAAVQSDTGNSTVITLSNFTASGPAMYGLYANGGAIRQGPNIDVSGCAAGTKLGAGQFSQGDAILTGAAPVTYAFADIKADDIVTCRTVALGATSDAYTAVISPGVGVVLTGRGALALDTIRVAVGT